MKILAFHYFFPPPPSQKGNYFSSTCYNLLEGITLMKPLWYKKTNTALKRQKTNHTGVIGKETNTCQSLCTHTWFTKRFLLYLLNTYELNWWIVKSVQSPVFSLCSWSLSHIMNFTVLEDMSFQKTPNQYSPIYLKPNSQEHLISAFYEHFMKMFFLTLKVNDSFC